MKRCFSLLLSTALTALSGRFLVSNSTKSPTLNTIKFPLPCLSEYSFCLSWADAIASRTRLIMFSLLSTKSDNFFRNADGPMPETWEESAFRASPPLTMEAPRAPRKVSGTSGCLNPLR
jgi:hypothetical protein